jgi:hypothetical protein
MSIGTIALVLLILLLVGTMPTGRHNNNWGYFPSGVMGALLLIVVVLVMTGSL